MANVFKVKKSDDLVANVKFEPTDVSEKSGLKILNVESIQNGLKQEIPECSSEPANKSASEELIVSTSHGNEKSSEIVPEESPYTRRYPKRSRTVRSYVEDIDGINEPIEDQFGKKTQPRKSSYKNSNIRSKDNNPKGVNSTQSKKKFNREEAKEIICELCSTVFFSPESLEQHAIDVHVVDKEFKCRKCTKTFIDQESLDSHKIQHKKENEISKSFKCPTCSRIFKNKWSAKHHEDTHNAVRAFQCKLCPKSYSDRQHLERHRLSVHEKKTFCCPKCLKAYPTESERNDHFRIHSKERTKKCDKCNSAFKTKYSLKQHRIYCRAIKPSDGNSNNGVTFLTLEETKSMFLRLQKCQLCNYTTQTKGNLKNHMVIHSTERNFKCHICPKTYKRSFELRNHKKTVHNEK